MSRFAPRRMSHGHPTVPGAHPRTLTEDRPRAVFRLVVGQLPVRR
ncbi:hypothetical protein [Streptomyces sp. NP-1717]|nr:hypothetical protein [Streptomyces sp. NP-1717]